METPISPNPAPTPEPPATPTPPPAQTAPVIQTVVSDLQKYWIIILAILALVGWILSGVFMVSYKQTSDKLSQLQASHSESVTISEPVEVAGKIVYKTTTQTVHDTQTVTVHDKTVTEIRSGVSLGLGMDVKLNPALIVNADLLPIGPGNVQAWGAGSTADQMAGLSYRLNF